VSADTTGPRGDDATVSVLEAWLRLAPDWCAWARDPDHDFYFWHLNLPALLAMIPPTATGRVLDLGCGEGRLGRELGRAGARVVGLDISPFLARAAAGGDPPLPAIIGRASALPFADDTFTVVVASMALHDMTDADTAITETARVLAPGGTLCLSIVHPLSSWTSVTSHDARASYYDEREYQETATIAGRHLRLHSIHRPTETYIAMLSDAGFVCDHLAAPRPSPDSLSQYPDLAALRTTPRFLHIRGRLSTPPHRPGDPLSRNPPALTPGAATARPTGARGRPDRGVVPFSGKE
jgi:SAM-dependent methyltransferase